MKKLTTAFLLLISINNTLAKDSIEDLVNNNSQKIDQIEKRLLALESKTINDEGVLELTELLRGIEVEFSIGTKSQSKNIPAKKAQEVASNLFTCFKKLIDKGYKFPSFDEVMVLSKSKWDYPKFEYSRARQEFYINVDHPMLTSQECFNAVAPYAKKL